MALDLGAGSRYTGVVPRAKKTPRSEGAGGSARRSSVVTRKDGRVLRRTTVYLPTDLARSLAVYCAERDLDMSDVVADAIRGVVSRDG